MELSINWTPDVVRVTQPNLYGVNNYKLHVPADLTAFSLMQQAGIKFFRFHHGPLMDFWTDATTRDWITQKVLDPYLPFLANPDPQRSILQTISRPPAWMPTVAGVLDPAYHTEYAQLCARLIKILNVDNNAGIEYWEPLNERNKLYKDAGQLPQLYALYSECAQAMKAVDPSIKVGGLAFTNDDSTIANAFATACGPDIDFLSFHRYSSTNPNESTPCIMFRTQNYATYTQKFQQVAINNFPDRFVPIMLNEYSINYDYRANEQRNSTHVGATWFASILKYMAEANLPFGAVWNFQDDIYGLVDNSNLKRPAYDLFRFLNTYFVGQMAQITSNDPNIEAIGVTRADGNKALMIWNRGSSIDSRVAIRSSYLATANLEGFKIDETGTNPYQIFMKTFNNGSPIPITPYRIIIIPSLG